MKKLHVVLFVFLFLTFPITGFSATITVSAKAEIQSAGHSSPGWAGELPPVYSFSPGPNKNLTFSSISGSISWDSQNYFNAEGSSWYGTDWGPNRGVSGIFHTNRCFFLIGVFLDDAKPSGPVPGRLSFSNPENFISLAPQLKQPFFIGDGRTDDTNTVQQFLVPSDATRLFMGVLDNPYYDNGGSLTTCFKVAAIPIPGAVWLLGSGLAGLIALRKSRRR